MAKRHQNHGLRKRCDCARSHWPKCSHSWFLNFKHGDRHYRLSLDRHLGRSVKSKTEAEAEAENIRVAIRAGRFNPQMPTPEAEERLTLKALLDLPALRRGREARRGAPQHGISGQRHHQRHAAHRRGHHVRVR